MTEATARDEQIIRRGKCPTGQCEFLDPQRDGYGRAITDRPWRFPTHAGNRWGRQCDNSAELARIPRL